MEKELRVALKELNTHWVLEECGGSDFGDTRLDHRFRLVMESLSKNSQAPLNQVCEGWSETVGAYRFINNERITPDKILSSHRESLRARAREEQIILAVQDTTYYSFDTHPKCEGLGYIGSGQNAKLKGLIQHSTLAITPEGVPLGVIDTRFNTREELVGRGVSRDSQRITEKESHRWIEAVQQTAGFFGSHQRVIHICDSEADIFELLSYISQSAQHYVIRSKCDRVLSEEGKISTALGESTPCARLSIDIAGNGNRASREAVVDVKYTTVTLAVPSNLKTRGVYADGTISVGVVELKESDDSIENPVHWILLTNTELDCEADALRVAQWYTRRWSIEELHKILKTGCRVEKAQFQSFDGLLNYITMNSIVAWRIYFLVHLLRVAPDAPANTALSRAEIETLEVRMNYKRKQKGKTRRLKIRTVKQALTEIAKLGGYLDRRADPMPGIVVMWRGVAGLAHSTETYLACNHAA